MSKVNFFTPISFGNQPKTAWQAVLESVDNYFYLGGKKACVIDNTNESKQTVLLQKHSSCIATGLKVASYITLIIPILFLLAKLLTRATTAYFIDDQLQTRLPSNPKLCNFYEQKGILRDDAMQIQLPNLEELGLDLTKEMEIDIQDYNPIVHPLLPRIPLTLRQATLDVVAQINKMVRLTKQQNPELPIAEIRQIHLNTNGPWVVGGSNLYFYCHRKEDQAQRPFPSETNLWVNKIITALANHGQIFQVQPSNGHGYYLQT